MVKKILLIVALLGALAAGVSALAWQRFAVYLDQPIDALPEPQLLVVEPGSSLTRVVHELADRHLLVQPRWLIYYLRAVGETSVQAGEYELQAGLTPRQLLGKIARGEVRTYQVTLVEGWTFRQALTHLQAQEGLELELDPGDPAALTRELGVDGDYENPEGWFFPDTYQYVRGSSDAGLLRNAHRIMRETLAREWAKRDEGLPLETPYEALILASIVERETSVDSERELIAGVFTNRLRKGMRLQTDPTVIYAMGDSYRGNIRRSDLSIDSPYNTYRVKGLPPTPIALPSARSIEAALHPQQTDKLYFVAKGDGSHHFSATLQEHNAAVQEYQIRNRAPNYRSSPAAGGG